MVRKTYTTKEDFDEDYSIRIEDRKPSSRDWIKVGYCRAGLYKMCERRAKKLVDIFNWPVSTKILIVGAGYGWTAEALEKNHGYSNIITTDTSPYIQSTQDTNEEEDIDKAIKTVGLDPSRGAGFVKKHAVWTPGNKRRHSRSILNESLSNTGSRKRVRDTLNGVDVVISEEVVTLLEDSEVLDLASWIDKIDTNIQAIHLTTELLPNNKQNSTFNWKLLSDWKLLVPLHTWVSFNTWQVL